MITIKDNLTYTLYFFSALYEKEESCTLKIRFCPKFGADLRLMVLHTSVFHVINVRTCAQMRKRSAHVCSKFQSYLPYNSDVITETVDTPSLRHRSNNENHGIVSDVARKFLVSLLHL